MHDACWLFGGGGVLVGKKSSASLKIAGDLFASLLFSHESFTFNDKSKKRDL